MGANCTKAGDAASPTKSGGRPTTQAALELAKANGDQKPLIDVKDLPADISPFEMANGVIPAEEKKRMADEVEKKIQSPEKLQLIDTTDGAKKLDMGNGLIIEDKVLNKEYQTAEERAEIIRKSYESVQRMANNGEVYIVEEEEEPENFAANKPQSTIGRKSTVLLFNNKMTFEKPSETVEPPAGQVMEPPAMKTPEGGESYDSIHNTYMAMILSVKPEQFTELLEFVLSG